MDYLKTLVQEIHSVVVATVDEAKNPHTSVMDMMLEDGQTVYFLTASFKLLFKRLKDDGRVSVNGMTQGNGTRERKSIALTGQVEHIGKEKLEDLPAANPYMYDIYPTEEGRSFLEVFRFKHTRENFMI
ncbi:pyridoxamine 5'-phosphate oxidase family protein [Streptococcus anginosus]|uniref:pyridoxamine 5'-phosphate oxidase family protein n=1 Tax=Streptococcus anginosus TaxID=1328 RepID=UPI001A3D1888|nr:pyridoxamine 5'-phosphate oxidase family protein [Streptococcus anginosus]VTY22796.1 Pyridoxamine 5'-phosphate oxidase [Streptococcus anginosus]